MMDEQLNILVEAGINLTALAVKGTVSAVTTKIKALKTEKDLEIVRNIYDELINEILSEREEAIRLAQLYKSEVDRLEISDEDIEHLQKTINQVIDIFKRMSPNTDVGAFSQFQGLINVDTLKAIQLLGFNFKEAIGGPLTALCSNAIMSKIPNRKSSAPGSSIQKK
jgi:uncharacterized protein YdaT